MLVTAFEDIRIALRVFRRTPGWTAVALVSIALGVGATGVVFAAIKSVLIDPLPYTRTAELVQIRTEFTYAQPSQGDWVFWNDAQEIIRRTRTLESVGIWRNAVFDLAGGPGTVPEALYGLKVTASLFPTLGVSPMLGRNILPEEDRPGHSDEMILSYGLWVRRFHADPNVVGQTVTVNGHGCLVIGVMPPEFNFPLRREATHTPSPYVEFWAPMSPYPGSRNGGLGAVARLRPGMTLAQAQQEIESIGAALARETPATNRDRTLRLGLLRDRTLRNASNALWLLMSAAVMFLLIGCANVANLLLARGLGRQREIAVRMAVGAGRGRIIRQFLTESCVLAVLGGLCGYALSAAAWRILPAAVPVSIPRLAAARADWTILAFALIAATITGVLFGMAPALRAALGTHAIAVRDFGARGMSGNRDRIRSSLVVAEVAVTVALVVVGGQLLESFVSLLRVDPGFQANRVLASVVLPSPERYRTNEQRVALYGKFLDAVRALPGVESAGTADALPFSGENHGGFISATQAAVMDAKSQIVGEVDVVGGEYLQTLGVRLLKGRWFRDEDMNPASDAAIVNDALAARLWPGADAIGKRICVNCTPENPREWKQVIGVVSSVHHAALEGPAGANVYLAAGALQSAAFLVVKTGRPTGELETAIRRAIAAIDPNQPVLLSATLRTLIADSLADRRFMMSLLAATACLALLLCAAGVFSVTSYVTSRRTQEMGLRMALGATPGNVEALVFRQGMLTVAIGLAAGAGLTLFLMRLMRGALPGLKAGNPAAMALAAGLVLVIAALACWAPARRATRIDPMSALREE